MSFKQALIDHSCNTFFPFALASFLLFTKFSFDEWQPYLIIGLFIFSKRYSFKLGYYTKALEKKVLHHEEQSEMEKQIKENGFVRPQKATKKKQRS